MDAAIAPDAGVTSHLTSSPLTSSPLTSHVCEALRDDRLDLIILPTEKCNFRCTYCYEDFSIGTMNAQVRNGVKALLTRSMPDLRILTVAWFGGEPLLAKNVIIDISKHIVDLLRQTGNTDYGASMTTNAYFLNARMAQELYELGVRRYQITLDGPSVQHDQTRRRVGGRGTFDKLWANLGEIRQTRLDLDIVLRVHVHPGNLDALARLSADLADLIDGDARFSILVKAVEHLGGDNDRNFAIVTREAKTQSLQRIKHIFSQKHVLAQIEEPICYAAKANSLVIRANGEIAKCTVALRDPRNRVGRITEDGRLIISQDKLTPWIRGLASQEPRSLQCPLRGL